MWHAACYGRTRAEGDTAPYTGDAALALMQAIFVSLWRLAEVNRELALHIDDAAAEQRTVDLNSCLDKGIASISKSRCAYMPINWVAHAVRAILKGIMSQLCVV